MHDHDRSQRVRKHLRSPRGDGIIETIVTIIVAVGLAWVLQAYVVKPYRIPSGSMENTLRCGDRVLVNRFVYHFHSPKRGDIIVFHPPAVSSSDTATVFDTNDHTWSPADGMHKTPSTQTFIKRLIGLPGDTVQLKNRHVYIDGKRIKEPYLHPAPPADAEDAVTPITANYGPVKVPKGGYLMMGDNRTNSRDGRWFGPITRKMMVGKAFFIYWPPSHMGRIPKDAHGPADSHYDPNCDESAPSAA